LYNPLKTFVVPPHSYARPLRRALEELGVKVIVAPPPKAYKLVMDGKAEAGIAPLALAAKSPEMIVVGPMVYSIADTYSVIIVSRTPRMLEECRNIVVHGESRTSTLYLALIIKKLNLKINIFSEKAYGVNQLLDLGDCALLLGDDALKARASNRVWVVADLGRLVYEVLGISPVYAVTVSKNSITNFDVTPIATFEDVKMTSLATGLSLEEAARYYRLVKLDYREDLLAQALPVIVRAIRLYGNVSKLQANSILEQAHV